MIRLACALGLLALAALAAMLLASSPWTLALDLFFAPAALCGALGILVLHIRDRGEGDGGK